MRSKCPVALAVAVAACIASPAFAAVPITHAPFTVLQAYDAPTDRPLVKFAGFSGALKADSAAIPGFFDIDPGNGNWSNYVSAAKAGKAYTIKSITLTKETPSTAQCADVFPPKKFSQSGTAKIRLHWPLMYEIPGTKWTLTILYGTSAAWDDDGVGPNPAGYAHTDIWTWQVDTTFASLKSLLNLFHEAPFGKDEVPLISDEVLFKALQLKVATASTTDPMSAAYLLGDFEMEVMDACIYTSPLLPNPTGPGTGVASTDENPACCKLLVDAEWLLKKVLRQ